MIDDGIEDDWSAVFARVVVVAFAFIALLASQLILSGAIHRTNYSGGDGKLAQATILTAYKFANIFDFNIVNPTQGLGSQLLPMNVWLNPAYWPFAFLPKESATDVSAVIALGVFAASAYVMARCFDVPAVPSAIGAQLSIIVFAPMLFVFQLSTVFCLMVGNAVVYAPHMIALGLLARLEAGSWRSFILTTAAIFGLLFYSLCCDPLWSVVHGMGWAPAFALVALRPFYRKTMLLRYAALGCCVILLFLSGALEYIYTLTQYTARVYFPGSGDRVAAPDLLASELFYSPYFKYFYIIWVIGWLLGISTLRDRERALVVTGMASFCLLLGYQLLYLLLNLPWQVPLPLYLEHGLFALFVVSAAAGYWGALRLASPTIRPVVATLAKRFHGSFLAKRTAGRARLPSRFVTAVTALVGVAAIPAALAGFAIRHAPAYAEAFGEHWPDEPELIQFFEEKIGLKASQPFRGSVQFWPHDYYTGLTVSALWTHGIGSIVQYGQLITPPSFYLAYTIGNIPSIGNGFGLSPGSSWKNYWKLLQLLGARYHVTSDPNSVPSPYADLLIGTFPRRPPTGERGLWYVYEIPNSNLGNYSPTELKTASSGAEITSMIAKPDFDFTKEAVLTDEISQRLVPARNMQLSFIRGGLHISGHSDGSSLVVLPLQFSHCLRPGDARVRLVRANLMLTGMFFSKNVDTDIVSDYGMFTSRCRLADLADARHLDLRIDLSSPRVRKDAKLFPEWKTVLATLWAAAGAIR